MHHPALTLRTAEFALALAIAQGCAPAGSGDTAGGSGESGPATTATTGAPEASTSVSSDAASSGGGTADDTGPSPPDLGTSELDWCARLPIDTWTVMPGTSFDTWAATGIPSDDYLGTDPLGAIVDAYGDPAVGNSGRLYFYGGGHGDGTCNAVVELDPAEFSYRLVGDPTPASAYPPGYLESGATPTYPSGLPFSGWFLPAAALSDPADAPYAAPALARVSTHMYAAAAMRGNVIHYFYLTYGEFDVGTGEWSGAEVDLGQQLATFRPEYGTVPLQQGTVAIHDEVLDRFFVTLNPGDAGGGWRTGVLVFDPDQRVIESVHEVGEAMGGPMPNSPSVVAVDRQLFVFSKLGNYGEPQIMHQGFVFDLDTREFHRFVVDGDPAASTYLESVQETIPAFYDGTAIRRWNYTPAHRNELLRMSTTPSAGTGSADDPFVFEQTSTPLQGELVVDGVDPAYQVMHVYRRLIFDRASGCAFVLPRHDSDWYALRPSP
jgi:hypothetical protein